LKETLREVVTVKGRDRNDLDLEVVIEPGKRARLVSLTIHEIEGEGISPKLVRNSVSGELSEMVRLASGLARAKFLQKRLDEGDYEALEAFTKTSKTPDGGVFANVDIFDSLVEPRIYPNEHAECAAVYMAAPEGRKQQAVAEHFVISLSAAKQRIKRARDAGYLPTTASEKESTMKKTKGEKR
jgi:hypothetical protein